jgi:glycosyltransferase involved in cell wall biosynthesis
MIRITYLNRDVRHTGFSIEGIFKLVKENLPTEFIVKEFFVDKKLPKWKNIVAARKHASQLNHVTGDVNFLLMGLYGKRTILTVHDVGYYENPIHSKIHRFIYGLFWYRLPLMFADKVTVVSKFTQQKLMQHFGCRADKIVVIPNPIKPVFIADRREQPNPIPRILQIGSGDHKNLDNLIKAVAGKSYHIDIVGWPSERSLYLLEEHNISYKVVNGLSDEELYEMYKQSDILYFASYYEGFGMPIIEMQAVGRPVITSNIGAMKEVGEGSAVLVDPNDVPGIRNEINRLVDDKAYYDDVVAKGFENVKKYHYKAIAGMYADLYRNMLK